MNLQTPTQMMDGNTQKVLQAIMQEPDLTFEFSPYIRLATMLTITKNYHAGGSWYFCLEGYQMDELDTEDLISSVRHQCAQELVAHYDV